MRKTLILALVLSLAVVGSAAAAPFGGPGSRSGYGNPPPHYNQPARPSYGNSAPGYHQQPGYSPAPRPGVNPRYGGPGGTALPNPRYHDVGGVRPSGPRYNGPGGTGGARPRPSSLRNRDASVSGAAGSNSRRTK